MAVGTKQMRIGKLMKHVNHLRITAKFWQQLVDETAIPAKKAYYQGKLDALLFIIEGLDKEFDLEGGSLTGESIHEDSKTGSIGEESASET